MAFDLGGLLQQYMGGGAQNQQQAEQDFQQVAQQAPPEVLQDGISEAFRSDQTPPFPQMVGQLFGNSNEHQQAGMLNQLLGGIGPGVLSSLAGSGLLGGLLGHMQNQPTQNQVSITPEQARQLTPEQVQQIAEHAEQQNPGIIDHLSQFYAQHPQLVNTIGGAALSIALAKMAQRTRSF